MLVLDFLITDNEHIKLSKLKELSKKIYLDKNIKFHQIKKGVFSIYLVYLGQYEEYKTYQEDFSLIVGNVIAFNFKPTNIDRIQSNYIRYKKLVKNDIDTTRGILGSSIRLSVKDQTISFYTDLISSLPLYVHTMDDETHIFSSHVNFIDNLVQNLGFDDVSVLEFLTMGTVSYPFTIYKKIKQVTPSSKCLYNSSKRVFHQKTYWRPYSNCSFKTIEDAANAVNKLLHENVSLFMKNQKNKTLLMSGGEDSRLLACIMKCYGDFSGYIILDKPNREYNLAQKAARSIGFKLNLILRDENFYYDIKNHATKISGNSNQYMHIHGLHKELINELADQNSVSVASGYLSDAVLKGSRIKKSWLWSKFGIQRKTIINRLGLLKPKKLKIIKPEIVNSFNKRKRNLRSFNYYLGLREDSEFFGFSPVTNYKSSPMSTGLRRIFNLFEPFASNEMIYISSKIPENFKLNRRIFNIIFKKNCKSVKLLGHTDGHMPFFSYKLNLIFRPLILFYRWCIIRRQDEGPWSDFKKFSQKKIITDFLNARTHKEFSKISNVSYAKFVKDKLFMSSNMTSLIQLVAILRKNKKS